MSNQQARKIFDSAIQAARGDQDAVARLELAREYFTNPTFRSAFSEHVWQINNADA